MAIYSNSKVSTFEQCPYKYKLQYIDKEEPEIEQNIEAFMGGIVHSALEYLYKNKKFQKDISKEDLIKFYKDLWAKEYSDDIKVVKKEFSAENYKKMGEKYLSDYYDKYKPFEQLTILGLETQDRMTLKNGVQWHVRIDKFACDDKGNYYVMDYKTNAWMKTQDEADDDRQLAMYSLWVKDKFKDCKSVKLVWHMLAFNKEVVSERTPKQLEKLQDEIIETIKKIESAKDFPTNVTPLCDYCGFKNICPSFKHQVELEIKEKESKKKFKDDDGLKLVDGFAELKGKLTELEKLQDTLREDLIEFAKQKGVNVIYGSNMKAGVKEYERFSLPEDEKAREKFIELVKKKGLWEDLATINAMRLSSLAAKDQLDKELKKKLIEEEAYRISLSKRKDVENGEE